MLILCLEAATAQRPRLRSPNSTRPSRFLSSLGRHSSSPTFFLRRGRLLVPALFVGRAAVALLLQDVADEDPQQTHYAEDGHQGKDSILGRLLLRAAHHRAIDGASGTAGRTFANGAHSPDAPRCWINAECVLKYDKYLVLTQGEGGAGLHFVQGLWSATSPAAGGLKLHIKKEHNSIRPQLEG